MINSKSYDVSDRSSLAITDKESVTSSAITLPSCFTAMVVPVIFPPSVSAVAVNSISCARTGTVTV